jgi:hypothetical protein
MRLILLLSISILISGCSSRQEVPDRLIGVRIQYIYDNDVEFALKFAEDGIRYQYKSGPKPDRWWGPYEYNYMKTENKEHFVSWFEVEKRGDFVTLLINFDKKILYGSGILGKKYKIHFHKAEIIETDIPEIK